MSENYVISDPLELRELSRLPFVRFPGRGRIELGGLLATFDESTQWEKDLNKHYFACGCDVGAKGTVIGFVMAGLFVFDSVTRNWYGWTTTLGVAIAIVVLASLVGKVLGLFRANHRLKQAVSRIQERVAENTVARDSAERSDPIACG